MDLKLLRKYKDKLLLTPVGRQAQADPQVLLRLVGEALRPSGLKHEQDVDVAVLLLAAAGVRFQTTNDFEDDVARVMNGLGWRLENGSPIHRHELVGLHELVHLLRSSGDRLSDPPATTPAARRIAQIGLFVEDGFS